ncbi:MAG: response regulator, partial [Treponema sp.]|nr:response regulator [Treponema sp.]
TANAVSGMREMFIEKGFNDFLAKPIDISKLDEALDRWIPKEKHDKQAAPPAEVSEKRGSSAVQEKKLIILVDDDPANLKSGKSILSEKYTVATVPSAEKMFSRLENVHPALILLDIGMPAMDGYAAIEILKSKPETADIPVVLLAETTGSRDEEKSRSCGAVDHITKPFDPAALIACIEKYL